MHFVRHAGKEIVRSLESLAGRVRSTQTPKATRPAAKKKAALPAQPKSKVVKLASRPDAEQEIPFEDTGTFGKF